jgi:hypothetical protein
VRTIGDLLDATERHATRNVIASVLDEWGDKLMIRWPVLISNAPWNMREIMASTDMTGIIIFFVISFDDLSRIGFSWRISNGQLEHGVFRK